MIMLVALLFMEVTNSPYGVLQQLMQNTDIMFENTIAICRPNYAKAQCHPLIQIRLYRHFQNAKTRR